eukprot:Gregarina_sp_Pseudo_9__2009@NODE_2391_length_1011_cov_35_175926_g2200_i0_p1_GENE_NODE_2391_length_1011_cov_35_175926_g2200_i0NODE_2391_length_1011_cov_35_175926_g2200_i0_p1_ORF_typecomplete_len258_score11_11_NODE_2391_length_1011_cov_35_175926_g2200_i0207980
MEFVMLFVRLLAFAVLINGKTDSPSTRSTWVFSGLTVSSSPDSRCEVSSCPLSPSRIVTADQLILCQVMAPSDCEYTAAATLVGRLEEGSLCDGLKIMLTEFAAPVGKWTLDGTGSLEFELTTPITAETCNYQANMDVGTECASPSESPYVLSHFPTAPRGATKFMLNADSLFRALSVHPEGTNIWFDPAPAEGCGTRFASVLASLNVPLVFGGAVPPSPTTPPGARPAGVLSRIGGGVLVGLCCVLFMEQVEFLLF